MALLTTKVIIKVGAMLIPKETKNNIFAVVLFALAAPILLITVLFTNGSFSDELDQYESAFQRLGCSSEYRYTLEDIRFFDSYTYPPGEDPPSAEELSKRMEQDYYTIDGNQDDSSKVCLLRSDEDIYEILHSKYNVNAKYKEEIMESIQQMRNGRQNFNLPVKNASAVQDYDEKEFPGILFSVNEGDDVFPAADGEVADIFTDRKYGLCITVKHEVLKGINSDGDYDTSVMFSKYGNLKDVKFNAGDKVEAGKKIANTAKDRLYFEMLDEDRSPVNPHEYMYIEVLENDMTGGDNTDLRLAPFDKPYTVTSTFGPKLFGYPGEFHYGTDYSKAYGAEILSLSYGEVIETNSTCAPNGGPTKCPFSGGAPWGGNYVIVKTSRAGTDYYIQYDHMRNINASAGQRVYPGQVIGYQGNSGNSYGSHTHIEIHSGGIHTADKKTAVDPEIWLKAANEKEGLK